MPSLYLGVMTQHRGLRQTQLYTGSPAPDLKMIPVTVTTLCSLLSDSTVHRFTIRVSGTQRVNVEGEVCYFNLPGLGVSFKKKRWGGEQLAHCSWHKMHVFKFLIALLCSLNPQLAEFFIET